MKTILVATDYSQNANHALEYAAALARGMGASLVLFNSCNLAQPTGVVPSYMPGISSIPSVEELIQENNDHLTQIGLDISEAYGIEVACVTTTDHVLNGLKKHIKKQHADMLVMGMRGQSLSVKLFGSVTSAMLKQVNIPLLVVPEKGEFRGFRRILFAYDNKQLLKRKQLSALYELAAVYDARVEILHVEKHKTFTAQEQKQLFRNTPLINELLTNIKYTYRVIANEDIRDGLERGIEEFHADLVAMLPHKSDFWESLLHPSLTKKMALSSHVPVLALPDVLKSKPAAKSIHSPKDEASNILSDGVK